MSALARYCSTQPDLKQTLGHFAANRGSEHFYDIRITNPTLGFPAVEVVPIHRQIPEIDALLASIVLAAVALTAVQHVRYDPRAVDRRSK